MAKRNRTTQTPAAPAPTPEQRAAMDAELRIRRAGYLAAELVQDARRLASAEKATKIAASADISYEMAWSSDLFATSAEAFVKGHLARVAVVGFTRAIEAGKDEHEARIDGLRVAAQVAMDEALRGAEYPEHSTSQVSNLMAQEKTAAYAKYARKHSFTVEVL